MANNAIERFAELVVLKADATEVATAAKKTEIATAKTTAVGSINYKFNEVQTLINDEVAEGDINLDASIYELEYDIQNTLDSLVNNTVGVRDSLGEISRELAADVTKFTTLVSGSSSSLKTARNAYLADFGDESEFVLAFDEAYTPVRIS